MFASGFVLMSILVGVSALLLLFGAKEPAGTRGAAERQVEAARERKAVAALVSSGENDRLVRATG